MRSAICTTVLATLLCLIPDQAFAQAYVAPPGPFLAWWHCDSTQVSSLRTQWLAEQPDSAGPALRTACDIFAWLGRPDSMTVKTDGFGSTQSITLRYRGLAPNVPLLVVAQRLDSLWQLPHTAHVGPARR